jgi:hypothetical protein
MRTPFEALPRRIFLDSCTAQILGNYGGYIYEGEPISETDRIHRVTDGLANLAALRNIFLLNQRALFEWIVSRGSIEEAAAKGGSQSSTVAMGHRRSFYGLPRRRWSNG